MKSIDEETSYNSDAGTENNQKIASLICRDYLIVLQTKSYLLNYRQVHHLDEWIELATRYWIQHCPFAKEISAKYPHLYPFLQIPISENIHILLRSSNTS